MNNDNFRTPPSTPVNEGYNYNPNYDDEGRQRIYNHLMATTPPAALRSALSAFINEEAYILDTLTPPRLNSHALNSARAQLRRLTPSITHGMFAPPYYPEATIHVISPPASPRQ